MRVCISLSHIAVSAARMLGFCVHFKCFRGEYFQRANLCDKDLPHPPKKHTYEVTSHMYWIRFVVILTRQVCRNLNKSTSISFTGISRHVSETDLLPGCHVVFYLSSREGGGCCCLKHDFTPSRPSSTSSIITYVQVIFPPSRCRCHWCLGCLHAQIWLLFSAIFPGPDNLKSLLCFPSMSTTARWQ